MKKANESLKLKLGGGFNNLRNLKQNTEGNLGHIRSKHY